MRSPATALLFLLTVVASPAAAQPVATTSSPRTEPVKAPTRRPPLAAALVCSVATALIPLGLGAAYSSRATNDAGKNLGLQIAGIGPALAPIAGHLVLGEWARAAAFGAVPVAGEIGLVAYQHAKPTATFHGGDPALALFATFFLMDLLGATVGITDVALVDERQAPPRITVAPMAGAGRYGLSLGGTL